MRRTDLSAPVVERTVVQFDHVSAAAADEVMVVSTRADAVGRLAAGAQQRIDLTDLGHPREVAVDGCQADVVELVMQLLRAQRLVGGAQRGDDGRLLLRRARSGRLGFRGLIDNDSRFY